MNCEKYTQWLSAALDGELTAEQRRELDAHLAHCPDCAALFELLSANARAMREMDCEFPEGLHDRIMNDLPAQEVPVKKNNVIRWKRWGTLAACLVLVAAAAFAVPGMSRSVMDKHAPSAAEAAEDPRQAPGAQAPSESLQDSSNESYVSEYSKVGDEPSDPMSIPSAVPSVLPEAVPSPAPEGESSPGDNGFGNLTPYQPNLPGISIEGTLTPAAQYLRMSYGYTPAPSARAISSASSLEQYLRGFRSNRYDSEGNPVPNESLEQLKEAYTDEYFSDRCLVAVVVESGSGSTRYEVLAVSHDTVSIRAIVPEVGTADMAAWLIVIEMDEMLDDGSTLAVNFTF